MNFDELKNKWPEHFEAGANWANMNQWSRSAKECFEVSANCNECPISTIYGLRFPRCYMPRVVTSLLKLGKKYETVS
jgi:hypothetical protein